MVKWTCKDIPELNGKTAVVTGANSGLGYHTALCLADKGVQVIMAGRNMDSLEKARKKMLSSSGPGLHLLIEYLDLSDLKSVKLFAEKTGNKFEKIDILINNAGLMAIPFMKTHDGFEMQFGVNHLGHFVLTGLLYPLIRNAKGLIIIVTSAFYRRGEIDFDNLDGRKGYGKWRAYAQSKLANLLFMLELDRRLKDTAEPVITAASHPGYAATELQGKGAAIRGRRTGKILMKMANTLFAQPAYMGALPSLYAAVAGDISGGELIGPGGFGHMRGYPVMENIDESKANYDVARRLWDVSANLTGVDFHW